MICRFVVLSAMALGMLPMAPAADVRVVEEIAAKVNGEIVTKGEIGEQRRLAETYLRQEQHLSGPQLQTAVDEQTKDILRDKDRSDSCWCRRPRNSKSTWTAK